MRRARSASSGQPAGGPRRLRLQRLLPYKAGAGRRRGGAVEARPLRGYPSGSRPRSAEAAGARERAEPAMGKSGEAAGPAGRGAGWLGAAGSGMLAVPSPPPGRAASPGLGGRQAGMQRLRLPGGDPGADGAAQGAAQGAKRPEACGGQFPGQPGSRVALGPPEREGRRG